MKKPERYRCARVVRWTDASRSVVTNQSLLISFRNNQTTTTYTDGRTHIHHGDAHRVSTRTDNHRVVVVVVVTEV